MRIYNNAPQTQIKTPNFRGPLDAPLTQGLAVLNTNPMLNASLVDVFAMGLPRTIVEYRERNKYAGFEMAFREFTGTFIACFSAGLFGQMINKTMSKRLQPEVKVNENSWASNNAIEVLNEINETDKNKSYSEKLFASLSGLNKNKEQEWKNVNWSKIEWYDKDSWNNINWENKEFEGIHKRMKSEKSIVETFDRLITDKNISKKDAKHLQEILAERVINVLGAENNVTVKSGDKSITSTVHNVLRDAIDMGKNVFSTNEADKIISKLKKLNKAKTLGALALSVVLALTNQAINRYITQKRTGSKEFVGNMNYESHLSEGKQVDKKKNLNFNKILASAGFVAMLAKVMNIKNVKDFFKKLEFTGPTTSGNAIKTVYGALILGRFFASKDNTELRETVVRDYLGFLNWLVLGGFVAKGVGNLLDRDRKDLFNTSKEGKGVKHWLNDVSLKTHSEIVAQGGKDVKKNLRKLNIAHISGLAYSALMLGILLPKLNIAMTKHNQKGLV